MLWPVGIGFRCFLWLLHGLALPWFVTSVFLLDLEFEKDAQRVISGGFLGGLLALFSSMVSNGFGA